MRIPSTCHRAPCTWPARPPAEHILRDTHGHAPQAGALSERVFGEFLGLFGFRRKLRLGSL
jgi:hypothetical protein